MISILETKFHSFIVIFLEYVHDQKCNWKKLYIHVLTFKCYYINLE